ncbi:MAG: hypothetical protein AAF539_07260 [Planctomycetota bacterium]
MVQRGLPIFASLVFAAVAIGETPATLFDDLIENGIDVGGVNAKITRSIDVSASDSDVRRDIAGRNDWKRFTRDSVTAPILMNFDTVESAEGTRVGHVMSFRFVAHQEFETLKEKGFLKTLFQDSSQREESSFEGFDNELMEEFGLKPQDATDYGFATFELLKRIRIRGIFASQTTVDDDVAVTAWRLLEEKPNDSDYCSTWSPLDNDEVGRKVEGDRQAYAGIAGYVSMTSLAPVDSTLAGACLVECHSIIHEPKQWFDGRNLLRSKLPLIVQESVRKFRRKLD